MCSRLRGSCGTHCGTNPGNLLHPIQHPTYNGDYALTQLGEYLQVNRIECSLQSRHFGSSDDACSQCIRDKNIHKCLKGHCNHFSCCIVLRRGRCGNRFSCCIALRRGRRDRCDCCFSCCFVRFSSRFFSCFACVSSRCFNWCCVCFSSLRDLTFVASFADVHNSQNHNCPSFQAGRHTGGRL